MTTPLRRRNGRKAACEACRRRKLACDHSYPTCQRCQKLSMKCLYFDRSLADTRVDRISEEVGQSPSPSRDPVHVPYASENPRVPQQTTPVIDSPTEYLGPTSFTSVFMEHGDRFELEDAVRASGSQADRVTDPDLNLPPQPKYAADRQRLQLGAEVLQQIPGERDCSNLFLRHVNPNDGWIRLAAHHSSEGMWNAFRPSLTRRSTDKLLTLAAHISANSKATLSGEQDPQAWLASFTGRQMRWETLGILYTYWAFGAISSSPQSEAVFRYCQEHLSVMGPKQLTAHLKHYAFLCIDLCRQLGSVNVLFVYLLYKHNILEGILNGDKSLSCWTQHGELVAVTTSIGLHRELTAASKLPTLQHEMKRRVFAAVFNIDKVISTFTGRPPMLSQACSSTCLPLDLSDEALLSGDLRAAAAELDSQGWNKYGRIYSTTILRSRTMFARIRHEILELVQASLDAPPEQLVEQAMRLKQRTHDTYRQLPESIIFSSSKVDSAGVPGYDLYAQILTKLECLLNLFLLERLLTRQKANATEDLVNVSQGMLELTLVFWKKKDRFVGLYSDFEWLACSYLYLHYTGNPLTKAGNVVRRSP
ncbi:hypothetical protein Asppvi_003730 [Aspergillus pseudoviridinutans]|uniref:Zn(2)-C6 fungal-type domain-containing protein n=1 Tax=Aspergillus pseudoviridinutans TaxID=1517512 RepID=A0A9P3ERC5_9EURO|nr:uncharacterized protein Asppvi_003730 [Aspergillus pseudoviridinutans]GIJ84879.1 hypothetical protein Asppvi_003730 [Aspergillus pseudoviridinutans]